MGGSCWLQELVWVPQAQDMVQPARSCLASPQGPTLPVMLALVAVLDGRRAGGRGRRWLRSGAQSGRWAAGTTWDDMGDGTGSETCG